VKEGSTEMNRFPAAMLAAQDDPRSLVRWLPWLRGRARKMIGPALAAAISPESLAQNTAMVYWRRRDEVAGYSSRRLAGWLMGVLRLGIREKLSAEHGRPAVVGMDFEPIDRGPGALEDLLREELHRRLMAGVDRLEDRQRQVLVWHRDEGLSHEEIGRRLGITAENSAVIHHRAIRRLRKILAEGDSSSSARRPR
jgi:RNA polymerase sigma factor (sigma-70 family)